MRRCAGCGASLADKRRQANSAVDDVDDADRWGIGELAHHYALLETHDQRGN